MNPTQWREEIIEKFRHLEPSEQLDAGDNGWLERHITSLLVSLKDEVGKEKKLLDWRPEKVGYTVGDYQTEIYNSALTKVEDIISKAIEG